MIDFQTSPERYKHWKLSVDGHVARLTMDVQEDQTLNDGYKLKLNSYDLGVDIELADAIQRLRFEHPEVRAVVVTSLKPRIFCAGANIYMLAPRRMPSKSTSANSRTRLVAQSKMIRIIPGGVISRH
jgi:benzoyl-CoA-dihydrodiol lyase